MKFRLVTMLLAVAMLLTGCSGYHNYDSNEILEYLNERYDKTFTLVSSEERARSERDYLDSRIEPLNSSNNDINDKNDIIETIKDENGVEFHVVHQFVYGFAGHYRITEDYCLQWLMSQPELYESLENAEFDCQYFNNIGVGDHPGGGFILSVKSYDEIEIAAKLAFDVIGNDDAILPDKGTKREDADLNTVKPKIVICSENGKQLNEIYFRTNKEPYIIDFDSFLHMAEKEYIELVKEGRIEEELPDEILNRNEPESIPVYFDNENEKIANLILETWWDEYGTMDFVKTDSKMKFDLLTNICETAGYTVAVEKNSVIIENEETRVEIIRYDRKGKPGADYNLFEIKKDGIEYIPQGRLETSLGNDECSLFVSDYYNLFGIKLTIDYENACAVMTVEAVPN